MNATLQGGRYLLTTYYCRATSGRADIWQPPCEPVASFLEILELPILNIIFDFEIG